MKEQLEAKKEQKNTVHDPNREPMTLSTLWQLWIDNLKSWRQYQEEHPDLFTLNLQAGVKRFFAWLGRVRGSPRPSTPRPSCFCSSGTVCPVWAPTFANGSPAAASGSFAPVTAGAVILSR